MNERSERAQRRRAQWQGEAVSLGEPKLLAYASLPLDERLKAFAALNARVWTAAGLLPLRPLERADWPGEIIALDSNG